MIIEFEDWQVTQLRNYFGENSKTQLEHWAFTKFDNAIKYRRWRDSVVRLLVNNGYVKRSDDVAKDIYAAYFNDGYSPSQAIKEDLGIDALQKFHSGMS